MAFEFLCPNGHLLQGEESLVGQVCQCPYCGTQFAVPQPPPTAQPPPDQSPQQPSTFEQPPTFEQQPVFEQQQPGPPAFQQPAPGPPGHEQPAPAGSSPPDFPGIRTGPDSGGQEAAAEPSQQFQLAGAAGHEVLHIPCPSGHELETPREMLDQDAMCPYCQVQFRLRAQDSREYRQEEAAQRQRREMKLGQAWLRWSIVAAVVVVVGLIVLIVFTAAD